MCSKGKFHLKMADTTKLTAALNDFYINNVKVTHMSDFKTVVETSERILGQIEREDHRYKGTTEFVGSMASHASAIIVNECDFVFPVPIDGHAEKTENPVYVKFKLSPSARKVWRDCADCDGYLDPKLYSNTFYSLVKKIVDDEERTTGNHFRLDGKDTVASTIHFSGMSADLVSAVQCGGQSEIWPTPDWFTPGRPWPSKETINMIEERGVELVAKPNYTSTDGDWQLSFFWRVSFAHTETDLINDATSTLRTFKKLLMIMKAIRSLYLAPNNEDTTPILKSYQFKILLLYEAAEFSDQGFWTDEKLGERYLSVLKRFETCIRKKVLPHLFLPNVNLFNHGVPTYLLRQDILTKPLAFIQKINSQRDAMVFLFNKFAV